MYQKLLFSKPNRFFQFLTKPRSFLLIHLLPCLYALTFAWQLNANSGDVCAVPNKYKCHNIIPPTASVNVNGKTAHKDNIPESICFG